jgi:hypothetical protein
MELLDHRQITMQIMNANRVILENTIAFVQAKKIFFGEKAQWLNPLFEARQKINKHGKIYNRSYNDCEVSREYIIALYEKANLDEIN